jgi:Na+/melibiose symporter-like transporter
MSNKNNASFGTTDYVKITLLGFAITALWQSLHTIILPIRLLDFVPESNKNTYLGLLTLTGLLLAMFVQPLAGAFSDMSRFRWGRRRPFILLGGLLMLLFIPGLGLAGGYATIFAVYCLLQVSSNIAQGPYQAFIPEMVPADRHGRASGIKGLLEIMGGIVLVYVSSIFMDRYYNNSQSYLLWLDLGILMVVLFVAVAATVLVVKESATSFPPSHSSLPVFFQTFKKDIWKNSNFIWFLLSRLLVFMAFTTIQQFALYYFKDVLSLAQPADATFRFSVIAVAGMLIVVWPAGYLSDRIGRKWLTAASGLLGAAGIGIIALSQQYNTVLWSAVLIGVAMGIFNSSNWALATDFAPAGEEARYLGIANMATAGGAVLARLIGPGIDFFNRRTPLSGYTFMLVACLIYFIIGALLAIKIRSVRYFNQGTTSNITDPR